MNAPLPLTFAELVALAGLDLRPVEAPYLARFDYSRGHLYGARDEKGLRRKRRVTRLSPVLERVAHELRKFPAPRADVRLAEDGAYVVQDDLRFRVVAFVVERDPR